MKSGSVGQPFSVAEASISISKSCLTQNGIYTVKLVLDSRWLGFRSFGALYVPFTTCLLSRMAESSLENVVPGSGLSQNEHISDVGISKRSSGSGAKGDRWMGGRVWKRITFASAVNVKGKGLGACLGGGWWWVFVPGSYCERDGRTCDGGDGICGNGGAICNDGKGVCRSGEDVRGGGEDVRSSGGDTRSGDENVWSGDEDIRSSGKDVRSGGRGSEDICGGNPGDICGSDGKAIPDPSLGIICKSAPQVISRCHSGSSVAKISRAGSNFSHIILNVAREYLSRPEIHLYWSPTKPPPLILFNSLSPEIMNSAGCFPGNCGP